MMVEIIRVRHFFADSVFNAFYAATMIFNF